jgi:hypothetical protein
VNEGTLPRIPAPPAWADFRPGLIWVLQCDDCQEIDLTTWYSSLDAVLERAKPSSLLWTCHGCDCGRWTPARRWFDALYTER